MSDLGAIDEDVQFEWEAARSLSNALRITAGELQIQIPRRNAFAVEARRDWQGEFAGKFITRMTYCTVDASRLAEAMLDAANKVNELSLLAREEQERREMARAWKIEHDAWVQQEILSGLNSASHLAGLFGVRSGEPVCPVGPPATPLQYTIPTPTAANRDD